MGYPIPPGTPAVMTQGNTQSNLSAGAAAVGHEEVDVVSTFLRAVGGIPEYILGGSYEMLVGYLQGRLYSH